MNTFADKSKGNNSRSVAHAISKKQSNSQPVFQFEDNRPEAIAQRKQQELANNSTQMRQLSAFQAKSLDPAQKNTPQPQQNNGKPLQRKLGFEMEIPVTFLTPDEENVATKMAYAELPNAFTVQGDKSGQAGQMTNGLNTWNPTIIELVTKAIDEHKEGAMQELLGIIEAIENFQGTVKAATANYTKQTSLENVTGGALALTSNDYANYLVNKKPHVPGSASPQNSYLHMTVGVSLEALIRAGEKVAEMSVEQYPGLKTHKESMKMLNMGDVDGLIQNDKQYNQDKEWDSEDDEIKNFLYLASGHVKAIENYKVSPVKGGGTSKNYTPFMSRSPFRQVRKELSPAAQAFLIKNADALKELIRGGWDLEPEAETYLSEIFDHANSYPQSKYFGGMKESGVEKTGGDQKGPPVEIRSLGTDMTPAELRETLVKVLTLSQNQWK